MNKSSDPIILNLRSTFRYLKIYFYIFFFFSIAGWLWEEILHFYAERELLNVGTLFGPWLPIYGIVSVVIYIICEEVKSNLGIFVYTVVIAGSLEYVTSVILELIYHRRWWDYSELIFNINGRVCVEALIFFGVLAILAKNYIFKFVNKTYNILNGRVLNIILVVMSILFVVDLIWCIRHPNIDVTLPTKIKFKIPF